MALHLYNSLTGTLDEFVHDKSLPIKWYTCGPTIYSSAHLGHARTFISFDIIRRVLEYLDYNIIYVMNITDIDDKIINKVKELSPNKEVDDNIYMEFISKMEAEFLDDMDKLNVIRPTVMTRVTNYIEKIKSFIETMENNGVTYCVNGTVYIDSEKYIDKGFKWDIFRRAGNNDYTECEFSSEKKSNADFSLWKASKPGEIKFNSKWGYGRPSWHIECSTMSNDILGNSIDIHSGGIDLIYPHHSNEIIQSIAHLNYDHIPIKFFLHSGHLNIDGNKMAKSTGNFITINDLLTNDGTPRQLRLLFLIHQWNKPMDFTYTTLNEAKSIEKRLVGFYANIEHIFRTSQKINTTYTENDIKYSEQFIKLKHDVNYFLLQNIDTRNVIHLILEMITETYKYTDVNCNITIVHNFVVYITKIFSMFGVEFIQTKPNEDISDNIINILVDFREDIRTCVVKNIKTIPNPISTSIFTILDDVRDNKLKSIGIITEEIGQGKKNKWIRENI